MNEHLIALLEELYAYGCAYIELTNGAVIEADFDADDGCIKFRITPESEGFYADCGFKEVANLLSRNSIKDIR